MYAFLVTYDCKTAENRAAFYEALVKADIPAQVAAEKGCGRYEYFVPCADETKLFLLEQWETLEDQKLHLTQPHMAVVKTIKEQFVAETAIKRWAIE